MKRSEKEPTARQVERWLNYSSPKVRRANARHDTESLKKSWLVPVKNIFNFPVDDRPRVE